MILGEFVKVRELLYTQVILNHINSRTSSPNNEDSYMVYKPEWYQKQNTSKYPYPNGIKKFAKLNL